MHVVGSCALVAIEDEVRVSGVDTHGGDRRGNDDDNERAERLPKTKTRMVRCRKR